MPDKSEIIQRVTSPKGRIRKKKIRQEHPIPFRGPRSDEKLTRKEWEEEYRERVKADPMVRKALRNVPPRHAALAVAWLTNGNNLKRAALQANYTMSTAKSIFQSDAVQALLLQVQALLPTEDQEWLDLLPEARFTIRNLLRSEDDKVRYLAAKDIVDRAEGKAKSRIDMTVREEGPQMTDEEMQLAFSIMQQADLGFAETVQWMRAHPDEVREWIQKNIPIQEAEVVEEPVKGALTAGDSEVDPGDQSDPPEAIETPQGPRETPSRGEAGPLMAYVTEEP